MKRSYLYIVALSVLVTVACLSLITRRCFNAPLDLPEKSHQLIVSPGSNLTQIIRRLSGEGVVSCPKTILFYARFARLDQIQAGEYSFSSLDKVTDLLQKLITGQVARYNITFPEGWTFKRWREHLAEQPKISHTLAGLTDAEVIEALGLNIESPEGWFSPSTYQFTLGDRDADLLLRAYSRMRETLEREWALRDDDLPYETPYEALIMASIIEKETSLAGERREIAGVFVRRLKKNMKLQTDPTVIYGLGERYNGNLQRKHLLEESSHNTYMIDGLPPTPIAMPGEESIRAALHPATGDSLFFVARGDGSHQFSSTLKEHRQAVRRFQIEKRREDYRSTQSNEESADK